MGGEASPNPIRDTAALGAARRKWDHGGADWDVLTHEMKRYEYVILPSGGISYGAPSGYHDDCVIALALANHRRWETENVGRMVALGNPSGAVRRGVRTRGRRRERVMVG